MKSFGKGGEIDEVIHLKPPGWCSVCLDAPDLTKTYVVDTYKRHVWHDVEQHIYVCGKCIHDLALVAGYVTPAKHEEAIQRAAEITDAVSRASEEKADLERTVDALKLAILVAAPEMLPQEEDEPA